MITIKQIAREAGVGIATVSRVLNGSDLVKEETRRKVTDVLQRHNFKPNSLARKLVKRSFSETTIGIILPLIENQYLFEVIEGIYRHIKRREYNIMIFNAGKGRKLVFDHIVQEDLAGLMLLGDPPMTPKERRIIRINNTPYVYLDHHDATENFVAYNHQEGGRMAARHLLSRGSRKPLIIGLKENTQQQRERLEAFQTVMHENGVDQIRVVLLEEEHDCNSRTGTLLKSSGCDSIFYFSDTLASSGLPAAANSNPRIPIIGYDDIRSSAYLGLTTIRQSSSKLGERGTAAITSLIEKENWQQEGPFFQELLKPELIIRET